MLELGSASALRGTLAARNRCLGCPASLSWMGVCPLDGRRELTALVGGSIEGDTVLVGALPDMLEAMTIRVRPIDISPAVGGAVVDLVAIDHEGRVSVGSPQATSDHSMILDATPQRPPAKY